MLIDYPVIKQIMPLPNRYTVLTPIYTPSTLNVCDPGSVVHDDKSASVGWEVCDEGIQV